MDDSKPKECLKRAEDKVEGERLNSVVPVGNRRSCQHILTTGKNKNKSCGNAIVCDKYKLCSKHNKARIAENYKIHGNYGNPDQAELWVKWINSVTDVQRLVDDKK